MLHPRTIKQKLRKTALATNKCQKCNGPVRSSNSGLCLTCTTISNTAKLVENYPKKSLSVTQRRLYLPVSPEEVLALATCDTNEESQRVMNLVIKRETARIRESWTEEEYHARAGFIQSELMPVDGPSGPLRRGFEVSRG